MSKKHRIISIMICVSMIFCLIVSTSALGATQVFSGKIVSTDNIDLSDVEIKIYSSERTYDEEGNFLYYVETYERSVYADADGDFEFVKPSLYCSYTINVETLPANYGVSKHTQFIIPTRTSDSVTIATIATAEADYSGGSFYAVFRATDGTEIYTDYDIVEDSGDSVLKAAGNLSASKDIKDIDSYTLSGTIVTNGRNYRYAKSFDISDYSETEKADLLCSLGRITDEDKRNVYSQYGDEFSLYEYDFSIGGEVRSSPGYNEVHPETISSNYTIKIKYIANAFTNYQTNLNLFIQNVRDVYTYFCVTNGFNAPTSSSGELSIYITSQISDDGGTTPDLNGNAFIMIKQSIVQNGTAEKTLAHEFMHAIMYKYHINSAGDWFKESFATMASLVYLDLPNQSPNDMINGFNGFRGYLEDFVETPHLSLTYTTDLDSREYGAFVFPLCIYQNHGGWATIKNIFSNYDDSSPEFDSIHGTYAGQTFNYESILDEMSIAILFPSHSTLGFEIAQELYIRERWPTVQCTQQNYIPSVLTNNSIAPLSNHYYSYHYTENIGTVYITAESNGDCLFNMFKKNQLDTYEHSFSDEIRIVFEIDNFGINNSNNEFILMVTNFHTSSSRTFTISVTR